MDSLKELIASKKQSFKDESQGKKYAKRSAIEENRLKRLREEEEQERQRKVRYSFFQRPLKLPKFDSCVMQETLLLHKKPNIERWRRSIPDNDKGQEEVEKTLPVPEEILSLSQEEVVRRLRVLKEPIKLFAETDEMRYMRLAQAERSVEIADEATGGQQANLHIALTRQEKELGNQAAVEGDLEQDANHEEDALMASFKAAAEELAEKNMPAEDVIDKRLKRWMSDWNEELMKRSTIEKQSAAGKQADMRYKETKEYLRPLFYRLKNKSVNEDLLVGIKLITDAMKERNYLHAYKLYMGVAIGNSPWPIGVTQVGLHERANREKISYKYAHGKAHIMNDEASRKFIQALKRIMTFCQRRYPTDPSRCADFGASTDDRLLLLQAEAKGDQIHGAEAPSYVGADGSVMIPPRWETLIKTSKTADSSHHE
jgi:pre-mRNA-splicing factor 18